MGLGALLLISRPLQIVDALEGGRQAVVQDLDLALVLEGLQLDGPLAHVIDLCVHPASRVVSNPKGQGHFPWGASMRHGDLLEYCTYALMKLDDIEPGVLARVLTAAPARRQAIFALRAAREIEAGDISKPDDLFPTSIAEVVRYGRTADIIRHAYDEVSEGLLSLRSQLMKSELSRLRGMPTQSGFDNAL